MSPLAKEGSNKRKSFQDACYAIESTKEDEEDENELGTKTEDSPEKISYCGGLIECPKGDCSKKFKDLNALKFHLSFAHNELKARHEAKMAKEEEERKKKKEEEEKENERKKKLDEQMKSKENNGSTELGLNLVRRETNNTQLSPKATAVVKPILSTSTPVSNGPLTTNGSSSKRAVHSPAYSDISDEDCDQQKTSTSSSKAPIPFSPASTSTHRPFSIAPPQPILKPPSVNRQPDLAVRPTTQTIGPPPASLTSRLPPPPPPAHLGGSNPLLGFPPPPFGIPPSASGANPNALAEFAAALAAASGVRPNSSVAASMDLLQQQYLATTKLQELQERAALHFPFGSPISTSGSLNRPGPALPSPSRAMAPSPRPQTPIPSSSNKVSSSPRQPLPAHLNNLLPSSAYNPLALTVPRSTNPATQTSLVNSITASTFPGTYIN